MAQMWLYRLAYQGYVRVYRTDSREAALHAFVSTPEARRRWPEGVAEEQVTVTRLPDLGPCRRCPGEEDRAPAEGDPKMREEGR